MVSLVVEASNAYLSVACIKDTELLSLKECECNNNLSSVILEKIDECIKEAKIKKSDLTTIVASNGPGSYTALRVVLSVCKTLAYTLNLEFKVISSLQLQALGVIDFEGIIVPLIDARRGYIFSAIYQKTSEELIILKEEGYYSIEEINEFLKNSSSNIIFIGKDVEKLKKLLLDSGCVRFSNDNISSKNIIGVLDKLVKVDKFNVNPKYLRETEAERNLNNDKNK